MFLNLALALTSYLDEKYNLCGTFLIQNLKRPIGAFITVNLNIIIIIIIAYICQRRKRH